VIEGRALVDAAHLSLGIETVDEIMAVIRPRNINIPVKKFQTFSTILR
jgi:molecular chaperone DnaK (HSP70)